MAAEEQSDRKVSHLETCIKQRCATEFLCAENIPPTDIYQHLWRSNSGCEHSEVVVGGVFQPWWQQKQVFSGTDVYEFRMQALVHGW